MVEFLERLRYGEVYWFKPRMDHPATGKLSFNPAVHVYLCRIKE